MSYKNVEGVPSIGEVIVMADLLDRVGIYDDAELLDIFIENAAAYNTNLEKVAGFWSDTWERMKGRTKRILFKEFRQAHDAARKIQEQLDTKFEELSNKYEQAKYLLKTYQLPDWYKQTSTIKELDGSALLTDSGFTDTYGKFMSSLLGVKEEATPEIEKVFEKQPESEEIGEWNVLYDKQRKGVQQHYQGDRIRISLPLWNRWVRSHQFKRIEDASNRVIIMVNTEAKGSLPENLLANMGTNKWEKESADSQYVYLKKVDSEGPKEKPKKPEDIFEEPVLPKIPRQKEEAKKQEEQKKEDVKQAPSETIPKEKVESIKDEAEHGQTEEKDKKSESTDGAPEGTTWIRYTSGRFKGKLYPVVRVRPERHEVITDKALIDKLNKAWKAKHGRAEVSSVSADDMELIASSTGKRIQRLGKLMSLSIL